ncbi:MSMEG_0570 family nitrogen starvation response protein [Acidiphilium sp. JA12-A1]|uniref:MSMEG_0570 family nitrogen starvation response protein n=1 Tax=Acidiphilium sp. JA12-A1 TaxID=1464546 RepID=UPI00046154B4|nr:MSMEG_0570 family nitrogen starvation response protein [Acidiphilium sp. JA12-A1]KDM65684.1 hypothetical protein ACIDI_93c00040 [Acidiphilium sp. JA12-A1]
MPELVLAFIWPDGSEDRLYSPSRAIAGHLAPGDAYPLAEFLDRSRAGLEAASARVEARYGVPCRRARAEIARIERRASGFTGDADGRVRMLPESPTGDRP